MIRQYLNTVAPINRCPGEILSTIFALSATNALPSFSFGHGRVALVVVQKLRPITLVCRSWRNIALHTPSLWCDIVVDRRWTKKLNSRCLALAKAVPLRIHARRSQRASGGDIMRILKESWNCVREAYLRVDDLKWDDIMDSLPTHPPLLNVLAVDGGLGGWSCIPGEHYFGGLAQSLRRLYVRSHSLPTDKFPNLTHFVLATSVTTYYWPCTVVSALSNMPRLQVVILTVNITKSGTMEWHRSSDMIVKLPHLRRFALKDCSTAGALLSTIEIPSTCLIQIDKQKPRNLTSIASLLYTQDSLPNLTRLRILPDPTYNNGDEDNDTSHYFLDLLDDSGTSGFSLGIYEDYSGLWTAADRDRVTDILVEFLSSPSGTKLVSSVTELWVHNWTDLVNDRLLAVIPPIGTLGLVLARPPYVRTEIPESLGQAMEGGTLGHCACPNLTSLYVYTCGAEDIFQAHTVATARKEAGHPLHRLAIECENAKEEPGVQSRVLGLETFVPELSVTIEEKKRAWWRPCAIPQGWSRHGSYPWPDWQE